MQISTFQQLVLVMSNLHDCPFDLSRAEFDAAAKTWTGRFLHPLWEDPRAEHQGFSLIFLRTRLPVAEASLRISGVRNLQVVDDQGIGTYSFNRIEQVADRLRLSFHEALHIDLHLVGSIDATYSEQPLPGICATYQQILMVQFGPFIEQSVKNDQSNAN